MDPFFSTSIPSRLGAEEEKGHQIVSACSKAHDEVAISLCPSS